MSEFKYEDWLTHFNPNHDPRNGQFASTKYQTSNGDLTKIGEKKLHRSFIKSYNKAAQAMDKEYQRINDKYGDADLGYDGFAYVSDIGVQYVKDIDSAWRNQYISELRKQYPEMIVNGEKWLSNAPFMNMFQDIVLESEQKNKRIK